MLQHYHGSSAERGRRDRLRNSRAVIQNATLSLSVFFIPTIIFILRHYSIAMTFFCWGHKDNVLSDASNAVLKIVEVPTHSFLCQPGETRMLHLLEPQKYCVFSEAPLVLKYLKGNYSCKSLFYRYLLFSKSYHLHHLSLSYHNLPSTFNTWLGHNPQDGG